MDPPDYPSVRVGDLILEADKLSYGEKWCHLDPQEGAVVGLLMRRSPQMVILILLTQHQQLSPYKA